MRNPEKTTHRLVRALGLAGVGLGVPLVWRTDDVAELVGVDDVDVAPTLLRAVGARELASAALLVAGPAGSIWTRVVGDAMNLSLLGRALVDRAGERRVRAAATTAAAAGIAALDVYAAVRTARRQHGAGRPGPLELHASTTVNKSPDDVYAYWRDLEKLPSFMLHLRSVKADGNGRSHWVANAPVRRRISWDAEITGDVPGHRLSWKSVPGSAVDNSGTVHFTHTPDGHGTEVRVALHYDVPGGRVGRAVAKLFGEEPEEQVRDDLRRFKQVLETGDLVRTEALPHGTDARHQFAQRPAQPSKRHHDGGSHR